MPVSIVLGNGNLLVNYDDEGFIQDLYWPHVGKENHLQGHHIKIHLWVDGQLNLCNSKDGHWKKAWDYEDGTLVAKLSMLHEDLGLRITIRSTVTPNVDSLIELIDIENLKPTERAVKVIFTHDFYIKEHNMGDTCAWYPDLNVLMHYKDNRYFGVGSTKEIFQYDCQQSVHDNGPGIQIDPQTGNLKMNPIAQGAVSSGFSIDLRIDPQSHESFDYFIVCGKRYDEIKDMRTQILLNTPKRLMVQAENYWKEWLGAKVSILKTRLNQLSSFDFSKDFIMSLQRLYERSLLIMRTQIDNGGAIIAANTSKSMQYNRDTYSYMWAADGAYISLALDESGFPSLAENFYEFCAKIVTKDGFLLHKYTPTGNLGSSWHPWVDRDGNPQVPLQEDETALPIIAIWEHYKIYKDQEFISKLWSRFIRKAADFLCSYRYSSNDRIQEMTDFMFFPRDENVDREELPADFNPQDLPKPSYDRWEQHRGIHTATTAVTIAGIESAGFLAKALGFLDKAQLYADTAKAMRAVFLHHMFDKKRERFIRMIYSDHSTKRAYKDFMIDATLHMVWRFGILPLDDPRVVSTVKQIEEALWVNTPIGGIARDQDDPHYRANDKIQGNPWYITTLWTAEYYVRQGNLKKAKRYIEWVVNHADSTGLLPEQADPYSGVSLSVKPLTWSHGEFVRLINQLAKVIDDQLLGW